MMSVQPPTMPYNMTTLGLHIAPTEQVSNTHAYNT